MCTDGAKSVLCHYESHEMLYFYLQKSNYASHSISKKYGNLKWSLINKFQNLINKFILATHSLYHGFVSWYWSHKKSIYVGYI